MRLVIPLLLLLTAAASADVVDPAEIPYEPWRAGTHYEVIERPADKSEPAAYVEVTEWFWFGCPYCFALEPAFNSWRTQMPADVKVRRVALAWHSPEQVVHAKLFYVLESLGREDLVPAVFEAIHTEHNPLAVRGDDEKTLALLQAFAAKQGLDIQVFTRIYRSPGADEYVENSKREATALHIVGTPTISINGRYVTSVGSAGGREELMRLVTFLVTKERRRR